MNNYQIYYLSKINGLPVKLFYFQSDKQLNDWKKKHFAQAKEKYKVKISKKVMKKNNTTWEEITFDK